MNSSPRKRSFYLGERWVQLGLAFLMLLFIIALCFLRSQISWNVEAMKSAREGYLELSKSEQELEQAVAKAERKRDQIREELALILGRVPKKVFDSEVLASVRNIAKGARCGLNDFRPGAIQKQTEYQTHSFEMHIEGKFPDLFQFFGALQHMPLICQVGRVKMNEPMSPGGVCRVDLELRVAFDHLWANEKRQP